MNKKSATATIVSVGIGTFMSSLDSSVVNLALPVIENYFKVTLSMVEWITTAYLLVVSSLLLTFGRMSDLYGHKKVYGTGFVIFVIGSLLCGLSKSIQMLVSFRVLQAVGAGMLFSNGPAIITNAVPPERRGKALSVTAIAVALGLCVGPVIGGTLSTLLGWQSIFFINIPIGIFGTFMAVRFIPKDKERTAIPFDITGSVLVFVALLLILLPLNISASYDIPAVLFISMIAAGLILIAFFIMHEKKFKYPMLNMSFFKNRVFAASNAAALFVYMSEFIMIFLIPFYFENLRNYSAMESGLLYMPMPLSTMLIAPISGNFSDHFDSRYISSFGAMIMGVGLFMLSFLGTDTQILYIVIAMVITGLGFGMFQTPNNSAIMGNVPAQNRGTASGTLATMRNIGMAIGAAVSGALFSSFKNSAAARYATQGQTDVNVQNSSSFIYALHLTFMIAAVVAIIAMAASFCKGKVMTEEEKN